MHSSTHMHGALFMVSCVWERAVGNSRDPFESIGQEQTVGEVQRLGARPERLLWGSVVVGRCSMALRGREHHYRFEE